LRVQATKPRARFDVTADGDGLVGHAGVALLIELADRLGLPAELDRWAVRGQPGRARHRAGKVLTDLAVMLADGGDCLSDLAACRDQPGLFGPVASTPTAWPVIERLAGADEQGLAGLRLTRARARRRAWQAGAWVDGLSVIEAMTRAWAAEYSASGVRVNAIAPGPVYTPSPSGPQFITALGETTPMHRASQPEEIAEVVAFLASPRTSYITGTTVAADGGRRAI
jgi:Enoyl-(Acyl carrier protein) reductase/Transposase DDE domain group 1